MRSSLGFHTMTLDIFLPYSEADKLLIDFSTYRKNTQLIQMYIRNEKNEPIIYYHKSPFMPLKVEIYTKDKCWGIEWCIRAYENPWGSSDYIIEATINPKFLAGITDYLTAATYDDMNIAITNFNFKSKEISPLLGTFNDYEIKRVDYCINISLENFGLSNTKNKREKHRAHNRCITDTSRLYALCFSLLTPEGVHAVKPQSISGGSGRVCRAFTRYPPQICSIS